MKKGCVLPILGLMAICGIVGWVGVEGTNAWNEARESWKNSNWSLRIGDKEIWAAVFPRARRVGFEGKTFSGAAIEFGISDFSTCKRHPLYQTDIIGFRDAGDTTSEGFFTEQRIVPCGPERK